MDRSFIFFFFFSFVILLLHFRHVYFVYVAYQVAENEGKRPCVGGTLGISAYIRIYRSSIVHTAIHLIHMCCLNDIVR